MCSEHRPAPEGQSCFIPSHHLHQLEAHQAHTLPLLLRFLRGTMAFIQFSIFWFRFAFVHTQKETGESVE